ncbi:MAG: hypothetical protein RLZZ387_221 [Chloroflexota bacterium]|jgi:polar amino acid transport system substrate-binding protein
MRRAPIILALALLASALVAGAIVQLWRPEQTLERVQRRGVIRVGYAPERPFAYRDARGSVTGEAPEVARVVLARMGIARIEWVQTEWAELIPELRAGRFDMIVAGMFITCERATQIAFTEPTYGADQAMLVRRGNPHRLHSYADVVRGGGTQLAVIAGAHELLIARALGLPEEQLLVVPDARTGLAAVQTGRADGLALTRISVVSLAASDPSGSVEPAEPFEQPQVPGLPARGYGAFGVRPEDTELRDALNAQLRDFIGSPEHRRLVEPFGFSAAEMPGATTTASLLEACER